MKRPIAVAGLIMHDRKKHKMTQGELSQRSGIDQTRLSRIETGRAEPTIEEAALLAELFQDLRIIQAICLTCRGYQTILGIALKEAPSLAQPMSDLRTLTEHFVTPIRDACTRIIDLASFVKDSTVQHEKSLLIIEESKRIQFLADALGLLTAHMG